jgi:hypothetical protein|tara:strand:+ start:289 stop:525 length:237 start_codon:yes stop_codon:yes gene_type:complete
MAKCLGRIPITSVAVGCIDFENIVAVAVAVAEQELVLERACSEFVQLLVEDEQVIGHQAVDCHKTGRIEYHLGVVDRN